MARPFALDRERVQRTLDAMERYHLSHYADDQAVAELEDLGYDDPDPGPYGALDPVATLAALVDDVLRPGDEHSPLSADAGYWLQVDLCADREGVFEGWRLIVGLPGDVRIADVFEERFPDLGRDDPLAWLEELVVCANGVIDQASRHFVAAALAAAPAAVAAVALPPPGGDGQSEAPRLSPPGGDGQSEEAHASGGVTPEGDDASSP